MKNIHSEYAYNYFMENVQSILDYCSLKNIVVYEVVVS